MGKKPYKKNRFITYLVASFLFFLATFIFTFSAIGYDLRFEDGRFFANRTGAIIISTRPGDASLYIDGKKYKSKSPLFKMFTLTVDKLTPGTHHLKIEKEGFENFEGDYNIEPSKVAWAINLILVKQDRKTTSYNFNGSLVQEIQNKDHSKILAVVENAESKITTLYEINQNSKEQIKIAEESTANGEVWRADSYSWDGDRILVTQTKENTKSYFVFDSAASGKSYPVSQEFNFNADALIFNPRNHDELYLLRKGNLQVLNYVNKSLGAIVATNVNQISSTTLGVIAVQKNGNAASLARIDTGGPIVIIPELPESDGYQIGYSTTLDRYLVLPNKDKTLLLYSRLGGKLTPETIGENADWFDLTPGSNYVFYAANGNYYTYDIDREKSYLSLASKTLNSYSWFADEVNLIYSENSKIALGTREGFYDKYLFDVEKDFPVFTSQNSDNVFFVTKNQAKNTSDLTVYSLDY